MHFIGIVQCVHLGMVGKTQLHYFSAIGTITCMKILSSKMTDDRRAGERSLAVRLVYTSTPH